MQFPANITMLRSGKQSLGLRHNHNSYIIGFLSRDDAQHVRKFTHINTEAKLNKFATRDVTMDVLDGLHNKGIFPSSFETVKVDESAELVISKKININKLPCEMVDVSLTEFITIPFQNSLGIIFATDIIDETKESFIYEAQVVEPCNNVELFRHSLMNK